VIKITYNADLHSFDGKLLLELRDARAELDDLTDFSDISYAIFQDAQYRYSEGLEQLEEEAAEEYGRHIKKLVTTIIDMAIVDSRAHDYSYLPHWSEAYRTIAIDGEKPSKPKHLNFRDGNGLV
jgi:hypothetical protein